MGIIEGFADVDGIRAAGNEVEQTVMPGCSHLPMWEQRDAYCGLVADWLARHDSHD